METMSPQQGAMGQNRSDSLTGDGKTLPEHKKKMKTLAQRRQSAPSLVISKALTRSRSTSRETCLTPVSPESCHLVQAFLGECPGRAFLGHAHTHLRRGLQTQERHLFLFTDALLVAKAKSPSHFKVKAQVRVCEMWTASCIDEVCDGSTSPDRSFVVGWPTCNYVATFSSEELKDKWWALIKSQITEGKENDDPKTVPLKIFAKDMGNCAYAKTLAVSNADSTSDVIRMALLQFGITGCVRDHRLWVSSVKDDPPYPLIGHEFPFSIKMSHIRDGGSHAGGGAWRDPASPSDCQGVLLLDQCLPPDTQCQFILKPHKVAATPLLIEPTQQKTFKRKRSLINWPFWKGSNPQLDGAPLSPTSPLPSQGRLFGRPLGSVCPPDHLPKPVMDMLVFLYLEGPYTRGVFRRSAGAKACRELRDRLDNGCEDPEITHQSVFVIAAVLKDFLRNVPGSVLCVDLYDQWMEVMEGEERIEAAQRLLQLLPAENLLLLRHVIAMLHCIQGNAHDNQMNAFNLSVCIAPSMLWAPAQSSPVMEGDSTKKVCELIHFLIENCCSVLEEDVVSLFRSFSQKSSSSDHGSDVSSFQMNDSSYDSLENELNDDPESPCRDRGKADSRSRDSVITLSDGEPDPDADLLLQLPPLARPRRFSPAVRQPRSRAPGGVALGPRRLRRSSEPALALASTPASGATPPPPPPPAYGRCPPVRKASYDAAMEGEAEDEVFLEQRLKGLQVKEEEEEEGGGAKVQNGGRRKAKHAPPPPLRLDASCSSLSSPATSPTGSSLSSLDSAFSQYSTDYAAPPAEPAPVCPHLATQLSPCSAAAPQREAPPPQPPRALQHHGLQLNTWLRKDCRLSLRESDNGHPGVDLANGKAGNGGDPGVAAAGNRRSSSPPSYQQALLQLQHGRSPFYTGGERPLTVGELRHLHDPAPTCRPPKPDAGSDVTKRWTRPEWPHPPPQGVFFGQGATTLVLQRQTSDSAMKTLPLPRRASEPAKITSSPAPCLTLERRRPSRGKDGGLRVSEVEPRFCLSPSATRAVSDYFSSHSREDGDAGRRRSQEVALAIVQGKREWQSRRCSDPRTDEFEQLFFAEESYV